MCRLSHRRSRETTFHAEPRLRSNALKTLAKDLRRIKPEGWPVVLGSNEIFVRPMDRTTGKIRITFVRDGLCLCNVLFVGTELLE